MNDQAHSRHAGLRQELDEALARDRAAGRGDPFFRPVLHFASRIADQLADGSLALPDIETVIRELTVDAFQARAGRMQAYLGECDPERNRDALAQLFARLATEKDFEDFQVLVGRASFGIVFTGHPTFSLNEELSRALIELATGFSASGERLDDSARADRMALAVRLPHAPPEDLTLESEHEWSMTALRAAHAALDQVYLLLFRLARQRWPERWTELSPKLVTIASWVGYDQDGRTDITWTKTLQKRIVVKQRALDRHRETLVTLAAGAAGRFKTALEEAIAAIDTAWTTGAHQIVLLGKTIGDATAVPAFARALVEGRDRALADPAPLRAMIEDLIRSAPDDEAREKLLVMRASLDAHGLSLADTHVRLNAVQLHNAIRRQIGLETAPNDPTKRRTYFAAINDLIAKAEPAAINFGSLLDERTSAKRLMMTIAEIVKYVDRRARVRFLIAETESAFTLLTALYYAKLFGVEDSIEISPLFETADALDHGERVIEEALKSPHFVAYLKRQGRLAVQFGYSDSGRFIGQMAATFRIERLRLRLVQLLERNGLTGLDVILFDTHGESVGRGGHPRSMADRLRYVAPPVSRLEFSRRGIAIKEEVSFQGGDGYLWFFTKPAALAALREILSFALLPPDETDDPVYGVPDFASEFFATVQQEFGALVANPDYVALLDLFCGHLIPRTGSRPQLRESGMRAAPPSLSAVAELRAIPNNARLQQLGYSANLLFGIGRAATKDVDLFQSMFERSRRFRRALDIVLAARELSALSGLQAYIDTIAPGMWLARARTAPAPQREIFRELRDTAEEIALSDRLSRVLRTLAADALLLMQVLPETPISDRRARVLLLHGLRAALVQRIAMLAMRVPDFSPQHGTTLSEIRHRLIRLDIPATIELLHEIFPARESGRIPGADFGEPANYQPDVTHSYRVEHETLFEPLLRLHALAQSITAALTHEWGAIG